MPTKAQAVRAVAAIAAALPLALSRSDRGDEAENTYGLPPGHPLSDELRRWFESQQKAVLDAIPAHAIADVPDRVLDPADWDDPMATACTPYLSATWDDSGKRTMARLGLDPAAFEVTSPKLRESIHKAALNFCRSTNETTSLRLSTALRRLRTELVAGLVEEGESIPVLTERIKAVFTEATHGRARRIAATETSRAYHAAQEAAGEESGVVAGLELLLSGDACPLCRKVATEAKRVRLGQPFAVIGDNPHYKEIRHPPIHPNCQCSMVEILTPEYGGPENPEWSDTLDQPRVGPEGYTPPKGTTEATPEPGRQPTPVGTPKPQPKPAPPPKPLPTPPPLPPVTSVAPSVVAPPPPPARPPGPSGTPVGHALDVEAKGPTGDNVRAAIRAIERVHGDGRLPTIPVKEATRGSNEGTYRYNAKGPISIEVHRKAAEQKLTLAHEVGHFLEMAAVPGRDARGVRDWARDPVFADWYRAVNETQAVKQIRATRAKGHVDYQQVEGEATVTRRLKVPKAFADYLLKPEELWARCYAQYIAARGEDTEMAAQLAARRDSGWKATVMLPSQWHDDEFAPVLHEMDRLFSKLGWRHD